MDALWDWAKGMIAWVVVGAIVIFFLVYAFDQGEDVPAQGVDYSDSCNHPNC